MATKTDLTGQSFGEWTVLAPGTKPGYVLCRCSCGTEREVQSTSLRSGTSRSCGCTQRPTSGTATLEQFRVKYIGRAFHGWHVLSLDYGSYQGRQAIYCTAICPKCGQPSTSLLSQILSAKLQCDHCEQQEEDIKNDH